MLTVGESGYVDGCSQTSPPVSNWKLWTNFDMGITNQHLTKLECQRTGNFQHLEKTIATTFAIAHIMITIQDVNHSFSCTKSGMKNWLTHSLVHVSELVLRYRVLLSSKKLSSSAQLYEVSTELHTMEAWNYWKRAHSLTNIKCCKGCSALH